MDYTSASSLITNNIASYGVAALTILTAISLVAVGLLVVRWGSRKISNVAGESGSFIGSEAEYPKWKRDRMISKMEEVIKRGD